MEIRADRLTNLREAAGFSQSQLAKVAGVGQSTIARLEAGETRSPRSLLTLAKALGCSPDYLAGESDELLSPTSSTFERNHLNPARDADTVELDEIDLKFGLGATFIDSPVSSEKRVFSREWLRNFTRTSPENLFWSIGDGDSMEPTIRSGEVMLIDTGQKTPRMVEGIWAVAVGDLGMVKRLHYAGEGRLELRSDNPLIPPIAVSEEELHIVGRVIAVVRRL